MDLVSKVLRRHYSSRNSKFDYLPETDRYLTLKRKSIFKFNIIGSDNIGQRHMRVTLLKELGKIYGIYDINLKGLQPAKNLHVKLPPGKAISIQELLLHKYDIDL